MNFRWNISALAKTNAALFVKPLNGAWKSSPAKNGYATSGAWSKKIVIVDIKQKNGHKAVFFYHQIQLFRLYLPGFPIISRIINLNVRGFVYILPRIIKLGWVILKVV